MQKLLEDWQEADIASSYAKGITTAELQSLYQCSSTLIYQVLQKRNIPRRTGGHQSPAFDCCYFDHINDEYKAYCLGLIIADGSVCQPKRGGQALFQLELREEDSYLIEELCKVLGWPIDRLRTYSRPNRNSTSKITIYSDRFAASLAQHGVVPGKSSSSYLPHVPSHLQRHLLRGLYDGDGSVGKYRLTLTAGNTALLQQVADHFIATLKLNPEALKIYQTGINAWTLSVNRKLERQAILTYLYEGACIAMKRKARWLGN